MNKLSKKWEFGSYALICDDHISYYTFFTIVLAACSYVWVYQKIEVAIPLTLIMLGYIANVIITAWLKGTGILELAKFSIVLSILYVVAFIFLFVLIFKIDKTFAIAFNVILFVGTGIAMLISLVVAVIVAVVLYFVALLAMRGLKERELRAFPKGHVLVSIAKKLHFKL